MPAWGIAPGLQRDRERALKARLKAPSLSIPHIAVVELDAVPAQQLTIFLAKSAGAMVLFLRLHVLQHNVELARAYRQGSGMNRAFSAGTFGMHASLGRCPRLL